MNKVGRPKGTTKRPESIRKILDKCHATVVHHYVRNIWDFTTDELKLLRNDVDKRSKELIKIKTKDKDEWQEIEDIKRELATIIKQIDRFMGQKVIEENDVIVDLENVLPSVQRELSSLTSRLIRGDISEEVYVDTKKKLIRIERRILKRKPPEDILEKDRIYRPDYREQTMETVGIVKNFQLEEFFASGGVKTRKETYEDWDYIKGEWYNEDISGMRYISSNK